MDERADSDIVDTVERDFFPDDASDFKLMVAGTCCVLLVSFSFLYFMNALLIIFLLNQSCSPNSFNSSRT